MRIWAVPVGELDTKRLVLFHKEWHAVHERIAQGGRWQGWEEARFREHFLELHQHILVEMFMRGIEHGPQDIDYNVALVEQLSYPLEERLDHDRWVLVCRWAGTYRGRVEMPTVYKVLIEQYNEQGGCPHNEGTIGETRICALCRRVVWDDDAQQWRSR
jgi:hypothetical protein